jgi:hypothetical protein
VSDTATSILSPAETIDSSKARSWRAVLAPYAQPHLGRSLLDITTSVVVYLGLLVAMYFLLDVSYWLVLAVSVPAAGFLVGAPTSSSTIALTAASCRGARRTSGLALPAGCSSSPRSNAGVTDTPSITLPRATLTGVASGTSRRSRLLSTRHCRGTAGSATGWFATRS